MSSRSARRIAAACLAALLPCAAHAAPPQTQLVAARAQAKICDLPAALASARAALTQAERETPQDAAFRLLAEQDIATFANGLSDPALAETSAREAVAIATRLYGTDSREWGLVAQNLAVSLAARGAGDEARGLFERIVKITTARPDAAAAANAEIGFSDFEQGAGRSLSALAHAERAVKLAAAPGMPPDLRGRVFLRAADAYRRTLRFREANAAADAAERALTAAGVAGGGARLKLVRAGIAFEAGDFTGALGLLDAAAAAPADRCDPTIAIDVAHRRGTIHMIRREVPEARLAFTQALAALAATPLRNDARRAEITYGLAVAAAQAREPEVASVLFDRAAAGFRAVYGAASLAEVQALQEKAFMYVFADRGADAVSAAEAAARLFAQVAEKTPIDAAYSQIALGRAYQAAARTDQAERALTSAVAGFKDARGSHAFDLAPALNGLGEIALLRRQPGKAEGLFRRALAIQQRWDGESALTTGVTLSRLAAAVAATGKRTDALALSGQAIDILRRRLALGEARPWTDIETERRTARTIVEGDAALVAAALAPGVPTSDPAIVARLFEDSQLANATRTGAAIAQLAARLQEAQGALAADLRRRADLADEWRAIQGDLVRSLQRGDPDDDRRAALIARQKTVYDTLGTLDAAIDTRDPNVDLVIRSRTVSIAAVRERIASNEVAISLLVGAGGSTIVAIDKDGARAIGCPLTAAQVRDAVLRLRAGLDRTLWKTDDLPPIDVGAANLLYRDLLGPLLPATATKIDTLLVITDGALSSLPLATLLTTPVAVQPGKEPDYGALPWLVRRYAIAGFPSAGSLVALRGITAKASARGFLGVGDPVLEGAKSRSPRSLAALFDSALAASANNPIANTALLRTMTPLPETRTELTTIRDALHAPTVRLLTGPAATETALRHMDLKPFGVIAFATHGLVAGELAGYAEPALVLTPPHQGSLADDGLLSASEIARLDLRADWVILSACSTAAGDGSPRAEPLSGLARAFFYAGARSLLVTHWSIDSEAAAMTTTATVNYAAKGLSSAKALRETQLGFIEDRDKSLRTHPFFWAAFEMIGGR